MYLTGTVENEKEVERMLAEYGHVFTKIRFTFIIEAVSLALLTEGSNAPVSL